GFSHFNRHATTLTCTINALNHWLRPCSGPTADLFLHHLIRYSPKNCKLFVKYSGYRSAVDWKLIYRFQRQRLPARYKDPAHCLTKHPPTLLNFWLDLAVLLC